MTRATLIAFLLWTLPLRAEVIEFPEEELATETVLPVFERAPVVKNRTVQTARRFELGGGMGFNMTEALYNKMNFHLGGTYHIDETHGVNLTGIFIMQGLSDKGEQLKSGQGIGGSGNAFDPSLAPSPELMALANYQFTAYYGKISVTKNFVMNLSIYGLAGLGVVSYGDSTNFGLNVGVGEKFYLNQNLALRLDLRLMAYQGPDPTSDSRGLNPSQGTDQRSSGDLDTVMYYHTLLNFGLVYLL